MKFSDFNSIDEMLSHYKLTVENSRFIEFDKIKPISLSTLVLADFDFVLENYLLESLKLSKRCLF